MSDQTDRSRKLIAATAAKANSASTISPRMSCFSRGVIALLKQRFLGELLTVR
jgi:hypothetical protein